MRGATYEFDPRQLGCRCDECPLGAYHRKGHTFAPVPPENPEAQGGVLVLADQPGSTEVRLRRPLIGPSGQLTERTLLRNGVGRKGVCWDNALLCRAPGNDLDTFNTIHVTRPNQRIREENKVRRQQGLPLKPLRITPQEACRPHVLRQLRRTPSVIAMGKRAFWSVSGRIAKIRKVRGGFHRLRLVDTASGPRVVDETRVQQSLVGPVVRLVPTINPAYALRQAPWKFPFDRDVERFFRWLRGELEWTEPRLLDIQPSAGGVASFLARGGAAQRVYTLDVETTYADALDNDLRTIGIFDVAAKEGIVIPWISINGRVGFAPGYEAPRRPTSLDNLRARPAQYPDGYHYSQHEGDAIVQALGQFVRDPHRITIGHNSGYFDLTVMSRWLGIPPSDFQSWLDQILAARASHSELPRDLYTVGTLHTDVPSWKQAEDDRRVAQNPRSYEELATYNNVDNAVVAITGLRLFQLAHRRGQSSTLDADHAYQQVCREMHQLGMYVAEPIRARFEQETATRIATFQGTIQDAVGSSSFNPRSTQQVGRLLFEDWGLPVISLTDTGRPSTNEDVIRTLLVSRGLLTRKQRRFLKALWGLRGASKDLNDVLLKMRRQKDGGIIPNDGIMRSHYTVHAAATGRISSSSPPTQNWRKWLRAIVTPRDPDHLFVVDDYDQIELRLLCAVAKVQAYLKVFAENGDPHAVTAAMIYGERFLREWEIYKTSGRKTKLFKALRRFAKIFVYASLYGGTAMTVYEAVCKATDDNGDLLFPDMTFAQVQASCTQWMEAAHEIPAWWETQWAFASTHGYILEPVGGRRRDFPKFERNEIINHPIQGGAGRIYQDGVIRLRRALPPNFERGTGLINSMHDAVTVECHWKDAAYVRALVEEKLTAVYAHIPGVVFSAEADLAVNWAEQAPTADGLAKLLRLGAAVARKGVSLTKSTFKALGLGRWLLTTLARWKDGDQKKQKEIRRELVVPGLSAGADEERALQKACVLAARGELEPLDETPIEVMPSKPRPSVVLAPEPVLYVSNWPSHQTLHGPGRKLTIMRRPRGWERGSGGVEVLKPTHDEWDLKVKGEGFLGVYARRMVFETQLGPGNLFDDNGIEVASGDTLCCSCSREKAAEGRCHRRWAAEALSRSGWNVVLDGEVLMACDTERIKQEGA